MGRGSLLIAAATTTGLCCGAVAALLYCAQTGTEGAGALGPWFVGHAGGEGGAQLLMLLKFKGFHCRGDRESLVTQYAVRRET